LHAQLAVSGAARTASSLSLGHWCGSFYFVARTGGVSLEISIKQSGQLLGSDFVGRFVTPAFARTQEFRRHSGNLCDHVETKHGIALRFRPRDCTTMDGIDDCACIFKTDPFAGAISAACPTCVHQPDAATRHTYSGARQETVRRSTVRRSPGARSHPSRCPPPLPCTRS